jgi:RNA polymerase sigma-70 factor (ECF subfamily)
MDDNLKNICKPKVFEKIFNTYAKDLKRFLYFKFRDLESAEDVMQDAFVKLWNNCSKVSVEKSKSFLYTVANNLFLNIKKHEQVKRKHQHNLVRESTNESPEYLMLEEEFLNKIETVIANLTEKQREVFLLSRIEKKKYKEIAEQLNISVKAVEKRMHKVLIIMRSEIGNV